MELSESMVLKSFKATFNVDETAITKAEGSTDDYFYFSGIASTPALDSYDDVVLPGAFSKSLVKRMPKMCYQHDWGMPVGIYTEMKYTEKGLEFRGKMPLENTDVKNIVSLMKIGALDSMSIGGYIAEDGFEIKDGIKYIKEFELYEVSIVTIPANEEAKITALKNATNKKFITVEDVKSVKNKREFENLLSESKGFSKSAATALAARFQGEPVEKDAKAFDLSQDIENMKHLLNKGKLK